MQGIDFREAISAPTSSDPANRELQNRVSSSTIRLMLFTDNSNAVWSADKALQMGSYPIASVSFSANRDAFRLQPGDPFLFSYVPYGIESMVLRVAKIEEESLSSEKIIIHAIQETAYEVEFSTAAKAKVSKNIEPDDFILSAISDYKIIEAPYIAVGGNIDIMPLALRNEQTTLGFRVYLSLDSGVSYNLIGTINSFCSGGTLIGDYTDETYTIDDEIGFTVEFTNSDVSLIESVSRIDLFGSKNLALLGNELIAFQNITPISGMQYKIEGIFRGEFDTTKEFHTSGEDFFYIGNSWQTIQSGYLTPGATRYFKLVPFNLKKSGDISDATPISYVVTGRAKTPYIPINFEANGNGQNPTYISGNDIILTWSPRVRGEGAGIGDIAALGEVTETHEGYFEIEVWVSDVNVRTTSGLTTESSAYQWTYTNAMNVADNGSPAAEITFKIMNYRYESSYKFESAQSEITVNSV